MSDRREDMIGKAQQLKMFEQWAYENKLDNVGKAIHGVVEVLKDEIRKEFNQEMKGKIDNMNKRIDGVGAE